MNSELKFPNSLSDKTLKFLIKAHKQKDPSWLDKNRVDYEKLLKKPFVELAENIKLALQPLAPSYRFPSKGLARIQRPAFKVAGGSDLYKDWVSMMASKPSASRFQSNPHLFFGLFPNEKEKVLVAAGLWMPTSQQARLVREAISRDSAPFHKLFKNKSFKARFQDEFWDEEKTARVPRGFAADHDDIEWIRLKKFVVMKSYSAKDLATKDFHRNVINDFEQGLKFNELLQNALELKWSR
jgi:uncharacterized protein (TIGR02453 family)